MEIPNIEEKTKCIAMQRLASMARKNEEPELLEYFRYLDKLISTHVPVNLSWVWRENQELKKEIERLKDV